MRRISASKLDIALHCQAPWTSNLPWESRTSPEARYGIEVHKMIEDHLDGHKPEIYTSKHNRDFLAWRSWAERETLLDLANARAEVKFVFGGTSASTLRETASGGYSAAPELSIVGTADVVTPSAVVDWKTGRTVEHPTDSAQVRFLATMADVEWLSIVQIREGNITHKRGHMVDSEREEVREDCRKLLKLVQEPVKFSAGKHCKWCPIQHQCPEKGKNQRNSGPDLEFAF